MLIMLRFRIGNEYFENTETPLTKQQKIYKNRNGIIFSICNLNISFYNKNNNTNKVKIILNISLLPFTIQKSLK